jgi:DNA adenine methylase
MNIRAFLRWAGSKRQLLPVVSQYWGEQHRRYVEPFLGSGSLFFSLAPQRALLGDVNAELIHMYTQLAQDAPSVVAALETFRPGKDEYYKWRAVDPSTLSGPQRAARFIYLNRYCFNGLYRTNRAGNFNVPYGGEKTGAMPSSALLDSCAGLLRSATLLTADFQVVLRQTRPGDLVFIDPPYARSAIRAFVEYSPVAFSHADLFRLKIELARMTEEGIEFVMCYAESDEAEILAAGFSITTISARRNIAGFAGHRKVAREWVVSNRSQI